LMSSLNSSISFTNSVWSVFSGSFFSRIFTIGPRDFTRSSIWLTVAF
jgi:hypothetical protein